MSFLQDKVNNLIEEYGIGAVLEALIAAVPTIFAEADVDQRDQLKMDLILAHRNYGYWYTGRMLTTGADITPRERAEKAAAEFVDALRGVQPYTSTHAGATVSAVMVARVIHDLNLASQVRQLWNKLGAERP
jgi:hypothetical protein